MTRAGQLAISIGIVPIRESGGIPEYLARSILNLRVRFLADDPLYFPTHTAAFINSGEIPEIF